jgi:hypothetical protein
MFLRKFSLVALIAIAIGGFTTLTASDAYAQASDTQSANINALINNPIVLANTAGLDFGSITPSVASTTVIISPAGAVSGTAIGLGGAPAAAGFTVAGLANQTYAVTLPADGTIFLTGPGANMAVDTFTDDATGTITPGGGPDAFGVGATLTVGANQTSGAYTGSFDVTVSYN